MEKGVLIKNAKIIDENSTHHLERTDILIENGIIKEIAPQIPDNDFRVLEFDNLHVSNGWIDMRAHFCEPGEEYKETVRSGIEAAMQGGFTAVCLSPETKLPISTKAQVQFLKNQEKDFPIDIFPAGTISKNLEGENLAELYDMKTGGAIYFTEGKNKISTQLLSDALLYAKNIDAFIVYIPNQFLLTKGDMHEGQYSTLLGMSGIPPIVESIEIQKVKELSKYHQAKVHFQCISSNEALKELKDIDKDLVSVSVAAHQLYFTDESLQTFDSNFKVYPPFRGENDKNALIEAVENGQIDVVCSDHHPQDIDSKKKEFNLSESGIIGLETMFSVANTQLRSRMNIESIISKITTNPRKILNLDIPTIQVNERANLTLFNPDYEYTFGIENIKSLSNNTPFLGEKLIGKALGTIYKSKINLTS